MSDAAMKICRMSFFPPLEKGRVTREARRVGIARSMTPTRLALLADLPLAGGGEP
jgi:hypothetical protein